MQSLNCPNCGAPITGERCEYCGAVFYDWATISDEAPAYIKMSINGTLVLFRARIIKIEVVPDDNVQSFYADNCPYYIAKPSEYDINVTFRAVPDDNGIISAKFKDRDTYINAGGMDYLKGCK